MAVNPFLEEEEEARERVQRKLGLRENLIFCVLWTIDLGNDPRRGKEGQFCSLHVGEEAAERFVRAYWHGMDKKYPGNATPDRYARPAFPSASHAENMLSYWCRVAPDFYQRIKNSGDGMWSTTVPPNKGEGIVCLIPPGELTSLAEGMFTR